MFILEPTLYQAIILVLYIQISREPEQFHLVTDNPRIFKFFRPNFVKMFKFTME